MRGYTDLNRPAFHKAARLLRAAGHEVFSPAELDFIEDDHAFITELDFIVNQADAIARLDGWELSRGARAECAVAQACNRPIKLTTVDALL